MSKKLTPRRRVPKKRPCIGEYLIERLWELGVRHIFGVPGDYVLGFYDMLVRSDIEVIGTTREDCAGFAADAYARVNGLGAVCVTYCVGGLSTANSIAGAYAEKSPVVVISGAPGMAERRRNPLLQHGPGGPQRILQGNRPRPRRRHALQKAGLYRASSRPCPQCP